jgi:hypothetical protein
MRISCSRATPAATAPATSRSSTSHLPSRSSGGTIRCTSTTYPALLPGARTGPPVVGPGGRLEELPRAVAERGLRAVLRALYAEARRDPACSPACSARCGGRRWSVRDQGPDLSRLPPGPHQGRQPRIFRSLVYNKGRWSCTCCGASSATRRFFEALGRFYRRVRFKKAGTDDLRRWRRPAGWSLERFFERWIFGAGHPTVPGSAGKADGRRSTSLRSPSSSGAGLRRPGDRQRDLRWPPARRSSTWSRSPKRRCGRSP